ncbi:VWA domain-containing protein [Brevibacillus migulae]|uniref:VWA domain-containing protein n=1 Tax=Brevibacillus migulae TaxID=1644114 RepID=UPI0038B3BA48
MLMVGMPAPGWAAGSGNLDAVLVVDVSNSMTQSDKNKLSNEAMKMFIDMTSLSGNKIGVVAYTDKVMREKALLKVNTQQDKEEIKSFIDSLQKGAYTDIAVGVQEAVKILDAGRDPANAPMIVLLADGNNDFDEATGRTQSDSDRELQAAMQKAKANGYPIYTIGLNADGTLQKQVLQQIASDTQGKFFEATEASQLPQILSEIFADHLKLKVVPVKNLVGSGQYEEVTVSIPNGNVLEANISVISGQPVEVKIADPAGKAVSIPSSQAQIMRSKAYSLIKLNQPAQGDWKLQIKGAAKDKINISLVFNYDLALVMEPVPAKSYQAGDKVDIKAYLAANGNPASDAALYQQMKGSLVVNDLTSQQTQEIALTNTGSGFEGSFTIPEAHRYELKVKADGSSFNRETAPVLVDAAQGAATAPEAVPNGTAEEQGSWGRIAGWAAGALVVIALGLYGWAAYKKATKGFIGQVAIEIRDEETGERTSPQYKKLSLFKGKVKLHQLLSLAPEFQETEQVILLPGANDTLILQNRSACRIEKAGRVIDAAKGKELKKNDRIKISLQKVNKSIYVDYIV